MKSSNIFLLLVCSAGGRSGTSCSMLRRVYRESRNSLSRRERLAMLIERLSSQLSWVDRVPERASRITSQLAHLSLLLPISKQFLGLKCVKFEVFPIFQMFVVGSRLIPMRWKKFILARCYQREISLQTARGIRHKTFNAIRSSTEINFIIIIYQRR